MVRPLPDRYRLRARVRPHRSGGWLERPTLLPALVFGVVTVAMPWLVMQPSFGLGIAASKAPKPAQARLKSLMTHTVFGIGLYLLGRPPGPLLFS